MKILYLMRHASAANHSDDYYRPLANQAIDEITYIAQSLNSRNRFPQQVFLSSATRTSQTFAILNENLDVPLIGGQTKDLYLCSNEKLLDFINYMPDIFDEVMIIAHNPSISEVAIDLCSEGSLKNYNSLQMGFSPASLAIIEFSEEKWSDVCERTGFLLEFITP